MKYLKYVLIFIVSFCFYNNVFAKEVGFKELIELDEKVTIKGENFTYSDFYYNDVKEGEKYLKSKYIVFDNVTNNTKKTVPVSINIALFDKDKKNIGILSYCSTEDKISAMNGKKLKKGESSYFVVEVAKRHLLDDKTINDIKYFAVLSENMECKFGTSFVGVGKELEEIPDDIGEPVLNIQMEKSLKIFLFLVIVIIVTKLIFDTFRRKRTNARIKKQYDKYNNRMLNAVNNQGMPTSLSNNQRENNKEKVGFFTRMKNKRENKKMKKNNSNFNNLYK